MGLLAAASLPVRCEFHKCIINCCAYYDGGDRQMNCEDLNEEFFRMEDC